LLNYLDKIGTIGKITDFRKVHTDPALREFIFDYLSVKQKESELSDFLKTNNLTLSDFYPEKVVEYLTVCARLDNRVYGAIDSHLFFYIA